MQSQLFIPTKLKVGYKNRQETYTGRLAYVTYFDEKGNLRKEPSWEGWRDHSIDPDEFKNDPIEGFVLNKDVGGVRRRYHSWDARIEKVRVFDPRNFEFEISIPNLLFILAETNSIKGKGLEGTFVYAWSGPELILLPTSCKEYKDSKQYTDLQSQKVSAKSLIVGASYMTKKQETLVYLGRFPWYEHKTQYINQHGNVDRYCYSHSNDRIIVSEAVKKHVFIEPEKRILHEFNDMTKISTLISDVPVSNYAELLEVFSSDKHATKAVGLASESSKDDLAAISNFGEHGFSWTACPLLYKQNSDGSYTSYEIQQYCYYWFDPVTFQKKWKSEGYLLTELERIQFKDGVLRKRSMRYYSQKLLQPSSIHNPYTNRMEYVHKPDNREFVTDIVMTRDQILEHGFQKLFVVLESGAKLRIQDY